MPPKIKIRRSEEDSNKSFTWSEEEIQLLLEVILHYKSDKAGQGIDWESVKSKDCDIRNSFLKRYPKNGDDQHIYHEDLSIFTKERLISKVKALRTKFKVALDLGRKSGGGRMVSQFYELCVNIWGGCPAVESIPGGLESSEPPTSMDSGSAEGEEVDIETSEEGYPNPELSITNAKKSGCKAKRSLIAHLKDARNAKLKKPLSFEKQMLQWQEMM